MSYQSNLDDQSGKLLNPAQLCLLLSIVLHLLLLKYGLPSLKLDEDSSIREVSVIELTPEQQSRLPNISPQLDPSEIPGFNDLPSVNSTDPAAPFAIPPSLIPGLNNSNNLPLIPIPPPPQFSLPPLPPITDITLPPVGNLSTLPLPPELDPSSFKVNPPKSTTTTTTPKQPQQPVKPSLTNPDIKPQTRPNFPNQPQSQPQNPSSDQSPNQPVETPKQIAQKKVANAQDNINNLSQSLKKVETGTTDEDATKNYVAWLAKVKDIEHEKIEVKGVYPRDACILKLEGSNVFGVVVDQTGAVVALDLIKGSKYGIFNQVASEQLSDRTFDNKTNQPKPYQVTVDYKYDSEICPSLSLPNTRKPETKPQPATKPETKPQSQTQTKPEAKPQPQPATKPETKPQPQPATKPQSQSKPAAKPETKPQSPSQPSLKDQLRNVPLPDVKPSELKDVPLPQQPELKR
ncbi:TonB family protein [Chondrocystis sp. NIES-4102]|nr:TonB family protein [Chondrocystis sp. NIES-4102]